MPMQGAATLQEYLISLGVQMDTGSMTKLMGFLSSGKLKAAAMGAAFTAAGKAIYGFLKSSYAAEQEMQKLARTQHKSIETIRAQQNALKAMGKTMQEVSKDPALKAMYNDLVKANKAMALPDMRGGISLLRQLQSSFYELRAAVRYSMQWINYHMLTNLKEPIQRITAFFKQVAEFIRKDINGLTAKLAAYLTAFTKGLLGIVEMSVKIADWVHKLPAGIKSAGLAISAVFALLKSGPMGQIMAVITAVGGLIDDYENWQWNKANPDAEQVAVAFPSIWELLDSDELTNSEKINEITQIFVDKMTEAFGSASFNLQSWVDRHEEEIKAVGASIADIVASGIGGAFNLSGTIIVELIKLVFDPKFLSACDDVGAALADAVKQAFSGLGESLFAPIQKWWSDWLLSWPEWLKDFLGFGTDDMRDFVNKDMQENGYLYDSETGKRLSVDEALQLYMSDSNKYESLRDTERTKVDQRREALMSDASSGYFEFGTGMSPNAESTKLYQQLMQNANAATTMESFDYWWGAAQSAKETWNSGRKRGLLANMFQYGSDTESETIAQMQNAINNAPSVLVTAQPTSDAGKDLVNDLQAQVNNAGTVNVGVEFTTRSGGGVGAGKSAMSLLQKNAWGGRYDRPITTEVAEDGGTEYIIPLSKPARAFALIKQMLGEMGSAATQRLMTDMGLGMAGTNGANAATISSAASGATINNNYNISAPVTIQVTASGADAKEIGTTAYNAAERQLIRSLKGVLA